MLSKKPRDQSISYAGCYRINTCMKLVPDTLCWLLSYKHVYETRTGHVILVVIE